MLNLHELEKRWLHYKIKLYLPYLVITLSIVTIVSLLTLFSQTTQQEQPIEHKIIQPKQIVQIAKEDTIKHENVKVQKPLSQTDTKSITLAPSLGFMKKMQTQTQPYYMSENSTIKESTATQQKKTEPKKDTLPDETTPIKKEETRATVQKEQVSHINITRENTHNDISEVIKRFKKNRNPALSLFVAKKYYKLGNYRQAHNYALITNNINQNIESSWIIFSKSLVKLGKRDKAIKTLQKYIEFSHSNSAEILLNEIRSGKFI